MLGFLVLIISFFLGMFTIFQAYASMIYGLPEAERQKSEISKKRYIISTLINVFIAIILLIITCITSLVIYFWYFIVGYFIAPFIACLCGKEKILSEAKTTINQNEQESLLNAEDNRNYQPRSENIERDFEIAEEINKLFNGESAFLSFSDIVKATICLEEDYKKEVNNITYKLLEDLYNTFTKEAKYQIKQRYDLDSFEECVNKVIESFELVANESNKNIEVFEKIKRLYAGQAVMLSKSDIVTTAINLQDIKILVNEERFKKVMKRFDEYTQNEIYKKEELYSLHMFIQETMAVQDEFNQIAYGEEDVIDV